MKPTYMYPAIFTYEDDQISVTFPDLPGCVTCGDTEEEALKNAKEAMGGHLWCMEQDNDPIPAPTSLRDVTLDTSERAVLIDAYMPAIRNQQEHRSVSRTVTLPAWMDTAAKAKGLKFSSLLQDAIAQALSHPNPRA